MPDLEDIESKITENTHAIVIINPNNPTGAVYSKRDGGRRWSTSRAATSWSSSPTRSTRRSSSTTPSTTTPRRPPAHDVLCLTFSGLSKAYRVCGYRAGWVMISGPKELAEDFLEGLTLIANMRMCANVPAQHAIQTALGGYQSIDELIVPGGRFYEQSMLADRLLNEIPGVSSVRRRGRALLLPPARPGGLRHRGRRAVRHRPAAGQEDPGHPRDGLQLARPDHFRMVTLPDVDVLEEAIGRIADFLATRR